MTREDILELQKKHTEIYKATIAPLYKEAEEKENKLKAEFNGALNLYFDTIFIDKNGMVVNKNDIFEETLYYIKGKFIDSDEFEGFYSQNSIDNFKKEAKYVTITEPTKIKKIQYRCVKRRLQFIFSEMLNNPRIEAVEIRNGKELKKEHTFSPATIKECEVIKKALTNEEINKILQRE